MLAELVFDEVRDVDRIDPGNIHNAVCGENGGELLHRLAARPIANV
jgi:hypothetical protein